MSNQEQIEYWNGEAGQRWAQDDDTMARLLGPICEALLDHAPLAGCKKALDIGCGGGSQSLKLAQRLGRGATVLGVDISEPMLEVAQRKAAEPADDRADLHFMLADASAPNTFPAGSFDLLFSRFGVMFFDDPLAAFTHMREALQPDGRLAFCCWQPVKNNDWVRVPLQAALQHLPTPEPPAPNAPGPFAFADPERVEGILTGAGFRQVSVQPLLTTLRLGESATLHEAVRELARIGPVSRLLTGQPDSVLEQVFPSMEEALAPFHKDGALNLAAQVWLVTAANG